MQAVKDIEATLNKLYAKEFKELNEWYRIPTVIGDERVVYGIKPENTHKPAITQIMYEGHARNFYNNYNRLTFIFKLRDEKALKELETIFMRDEHFAGLGRTTDEIEKLKSECLKPNSRKIGFLDYHCMGKSNTEHALVVRLLERPNDADYLDLFFATVAKFEAIPGIITKDIKFVIAANCVASFKQKIDRFKSEEEVINFIEDENNQSTLRPCSIKDAPSSVYLAAQYCKSKNFYKAMYLLLRTVPPSHRQYKEAQESLKFMSMEHSTWLSKHLDKNKELQDGNKQLMEAIKQRIPESGKGAAAAVASATPQAAAAPILVAAASAVKPTSIAAAPAIHPSAASEKYAGPNAVNRASTGNSPLHKVGIRQ